MVLKLTMSIRSVWIISLSSQDKDKLLFSRCFPTVEKQAKIYDGDYYVPPPDATQFIKCFLQAIGVSANPEGNFSKEDQTPVCEVQTANGCLWPVLFIEQHGLVYCSLSLVKKGSHTRPPLVSIDGISSGFTLLLAMADFLGPASRTYSKTHSRFAELYVYLGQAAPFGSPVEVVASRLNALAVNSKSMAQTGQKQPSWKPIAHKGKASIQLTVKEHIRAVQYDRKGVPDVWDLYGSVTCKAEMESLSAEVTLTLGHADSASWTPLENILYHPCVQTSQSQGAFLPGASKTSKGLDSCRMRIMPPSEPFILCHYTANLLRELPIDGFFQMKGEKTVELLIQLKLDDHVKNSFEYCELQIPFYHRGPILSFEANASHGQVITSPDKSFLDWNIGTKFPTKTREVMLKATVYFSKYEVKPGNKFDEQFCVGLNSYAQLFFKIPDFTLSGASIDSKSIQISPNVKLKSTIGRELVSGEYKIWNSHGDSPIAYTPTYEELKLLKTANSSQ